MQSTMVQTKCSEFRGLSRPGVPVSGRTRTKDVDDDETILTDDEAPRTDHILTGLCRVTNSNGRSVGRSTKRPFW